MNKRAVVVDSVAMVKDELAETKQVTAKAELVRSVMTEELGMRYRKILKGSLHTNSDKNLLLR